LLRKPWNLLVYKKIKKGKEKTKNELNLDFVRGIGSLEVNLLSFGHKKRI
jgi:hypothetical protein